MSVTIRSSTNAVQVGRDVFGACPSLATIRVVNPLVWSRVLSAMNTDPSFLYKFVRKYEGQIMTHHRSSRCIESVYLYIRNQRWIHSYLWWHKIRVLKGQAGVWNYCRLYRLSDNSTRGTDLPAIDAACIGVYRRRTIHTIRRGGRRRRLLIQY